MRKMSAILFGFLIATLISMSTISPAKADIQQFSWQLPYTYRGYESQFYGGYYIVGYEHGTTVNLEVLVKNDYWTLDNINVTAVSVVFDTGFNVTSDLTAAPIKINYNKYQSFDVSFTANVTKLTNLQTHTYTIYVKFNYTATLTDTYVSYWNSISPPTRFVVFSASQVDVMELKREYDATSTSWYNFDTTEAQSLARQANAEGTIAEAYLDNWDFDNAKTHYQTALSLYNQTFVAENKTGSKIEDAQINYYNAAVTQANAAMTQAYAWLMLGIGMILIGIGVIIYAFRQPKVPKAS